VVERLDFCVAILGPDAPHVGRGAGKSKATRLSPTRWCAAAAGQRSFRSTLLFPTADEPQLATAREAMRRALARGSIGGDRCQNKDVNLLLQGQMTQAQQADARDQARSGREGAVRRPVRAVLIPVESTQAGKSFDLDHQPITAHERSGIPAAVYEKAIAKGDGIVKETVSSAAPVSSNSRLNRRVLRIKASPVPSRAGRSFHSRPHTPTT
jgi:hypothetical protein